METSTLVRKGYMGKYLPARDLHRCLLTLFRHPQVGLIDDYRWGLFEAKMARVEEEKERLASVKVGPAC